MNVSLTAELERAVHEKVASGLYNKAGEVMRDALRLMLKRDELGDLHDDWLRAEIEVGWQAAVSVAAPITDPLMCIIRSGQGERVSPELAELLNPVDPSTFHLYRLPANTDVELHYHDIDEYWWFVSGHPRVTLRTPDGNRRDFDLGPEDLVACVRGVEHTLWADHELVYHQYSSLPKEGEGGGHLTR